MHLWRKVRVWWWRVRICSEKSVDLSWMDIGDEEAVAIANALKVTNTLENLSLYRNRIGAQGAAAIAAALRDGNGTVETLGLGSNAIGDAGAAAIASALETSNSTARLKELYVGRNGIGDAGAKALSAALKKNATLTKLNLYDNDVSDDSARSIRDALLEGEYNTALKHISLRENDIDDALLDEIDFVLKHDPETRSNLIRETTGGFLTAVPAGDDKTASSSPAPETRRTVASSAAAPKKKGPAAAAAAAAPAPMRYDWWMAPHRWFPQAAAPGRPHTYHLAQADHHRRALVVSASAEGGGGGGGGDGPLY